MVKIYRNDAGSFVDIYAVLQPADYMALSWGDYDNDGDLDILLVGYNNDTDDYNYARVYQNVGGNFNVAAELPPVKYVRWDSGVKWGDYDNDGDLDILLAGAIVENGDTDVAITRIYRNDEGNFVDIEAEIMGLWMASVNWGDYDNDGDLDILISGTSNPYNIQYTLVYRNDGGTFTDIGAGLMDEGCFGAWGDYDNDGDLDIILATSYSENNVAVYENDNGTFTDMELAIQSADYTYASFADYDNDGDLDILLSGERNNPLEAISHLYVNGTMIANVAPNCPTNLSYMNGVICWDAGTDIETPTAGLSYNISIGTSPGIEDICPGMSDMSTGFRRVVHIGNAGHNLFWPLSITPGIGETYFCRVQAVDGAYAGSMYSEEISFEHVTGIDGDTPAYEYVLDHARPNPFNPSTTISYKIAASSHARLEIFDTAGRTIKVLVDDHRETGEYQEIWDGRDGKGMEMPSAVYFYRLTAGGHSETRRMVLVK
jgi:hypothetical protein